MPKTCVLCVILRVLCVEIFITTFHTKVVLKVKNRCPPTCALFVPHISIVYLLISTDATDAHRFYLTITLTVLRKSFIVINSLKYHIFNYLLMHLKLCIFNIDG